MNILEYIANELTERKQTLTCAESCTGGLLSAAITSRAGSSAFFERAYITYADSAKTQILNVNVNTLRHYGAVSKETVQEMALGALIAAKSDYALSISGIAGPDGGTEEKPVGTVWFGLATKGQIFAEHALFEGDRQQIREQAVRFALRFFATYLYNHRK